MRFFANVNVAPWLRSDELFLLSESGRSPGEEVRFAPDSSVAGAGFEPSVPLTTTLREISRSTFFVFQPSRESPLLAKKDQGFESFSLQWCVHCEPDFLFCGPR